MGSESKDASFRGFLKERNRIHEDIKEFLLIVLQCCFNIEENAEGRNPELKADLTTKIKNSLPSLFESLCFIHALYGYPQANSDETGKN